jgi:arsenite-transporting ATPase
VNKLFRNSESCDCDRCRRDEARHAERVAAVETTFDYPVRRVPELAGESQGLDALARVGSTLV